MRNVINNSQYIITDISPNNDKKEAVVCKQATKYRNMTICIF